MSVLNSLFKSKMIFFHVKLKRFGMSQNEVGIKIIRREVLIQFMDQLKIVDEGSKTENKFVIIFNLLDEKWLLLFWKN